MISPFPFLNNLPRKQVILIHNILLADWEVEEKHKHIVSELRQSKCKCLPEQCKCLEQYYAWLEKEVRSPPYEVLQTLMPEINSHLFRLLHENRFKEIPCLLECLDKPDISPGIKKMADEWISKILDTRKLLATGLAEAKDILLKTSSPQEAIDSCTREFQQIKLDDASSLNGNTSYQAMGRSAARVRGSAENIVDKNIGIPLSPPTVKKTTCPQCKCVFALYPNVLTRQMLTPREEILQEAAYIPPPDYNGPQVKELERSYVTASKTSMEQNSSPHTPRNPSPPVEVIIAPKPKTDPLRRSLSMRNPKRNEEMKPPPKSCAPSPTALGGDQPAGTLHFFNVLLLGETGVGKTTFINSFANYIKYGSLNEALEKKPIILTKSSITRGSNVLLENGTDEIRQDTITIESNCERGNRKSGNEHFDVKGESSTQDPLIHTIKWEENGTIKFLRLIDTPGVNDTRGTRQDDANFDKIVRLITHVGTLNAICILLKPNEKRLSVGFRKRLDSIFLKLHRDATKNILFCFTNTRSTLYRPGDTWEPLNAYLRQVEKTSAVKIPLNKDNIFCFDNDCFRYMCILMMDATSEQDERTHSTLSAGWVHNIGQCKRLLAKIQGLMVHQVDDTVNIEKARKFLTSMAGPLTDLVIDQLMNKNYVEVQIKEIEGLKDKDRKMETIMERKRRVVRRVKLPHPRTVCTSLLCTDVYQEEPGCQKDYVPRINCTDNYTRKMQPLYTDNNQPTQNIALKEDTLGTDKCVDCGCSFLKHILQTSRNVVTWESVATPEDLEKLKGCNSYKQKAEIILKELRTKARNYEYECDRIKETSVEFSALLQFNALKVGADPYLTYLRNIIEIEENMAKRREGSTILTDLYRLRNEYQEGISRSLKDMKENRKSPLTTAGIQQKLQTLSMLQLSGKLIADIVKDLNEQTSSMEL